MRLNKGDLLEKERALKAEGVNKHPPSSQVIQQQTGRSIDN